MNKLQDKKNLYGILTFHKAHNYGALLQAYALSYTIKKYNKDVFFVDYENETLTKGYTLFPIFNKYSPVSYIKEWIHLILDFKRKYKRYHAFSRFINNYIKPLSVSKNNAFDVVFLGSDQIWNASYTNGVDSNYYGQGEGLNANKLVSYAASMGKLSLNGKDEEEFISLIQGINEIGVREKYLKDYIEDKTGRECVVNLDPTLLLDRQEWESLSKRFNSDERYLLVYEMHPHSEMSRIANQIAESLNLKIKVLASRTNYKISKDAITDADPRDFLMYFANASFILTTSFHGTVFSIINEIPFYTLCFGNEVDLRSSSLLELVNLKNRMIPGIESIDSNNENLHFNFEEASKILQDHRRNSINFITQALGFRHE